MYVLVHFGFSSFTMIDFGQLSFAWEQCKYKLLQCHFTKLPYIFNIIKLFPQNQLNIIPYLNKMLMSNILIMKQNYKIDNVM